MKVIPIIVAFPMEREAFKVFHHLNQKCNLDKGVDFNIVIPHVTLWMGFMNESDVLTLGKEFYNVFGNISIPLTLSTVELFAGINGNVLSVGVKNNRTLHLLQNRVHHFFEPYRCKSNHYSTFNTDTVNYLNGFGNKSLAQYDPHVTIGFIDEILELSIEDFTVSEPKMFLAGNNCTCLKVID